MENSILALMPIMSLIATELCIGSLCLVLSYRRMKFENYEVVLMLSMLAGVVIWAFLCSQMGLSAPIHVHL